MPRARPVLACDCETDPFLHARVPVPFIWGLTNGNWFKTYKDTADFVADVIERDCILYAHNGGKFDFMFLLPFVKETKAMIINGRIVSMFLGRAELRDSYACVPVAMKEIKKDEIEYWKLEKECRDDHMPEILKYLESDCRYLHEIISAYRNVAGTQKTIASNALRFAKKIGIDPGKTTNTFDTKFRRFYYGGRTECFQPGEHKNIDVLDIRSAYPFAMLHDHWTGPLYNTASKIGNLTRDEIQRSFITLECTSRGAFPLRTKQGLMFPHEYNEFRVSGWEYLAAKDLGLISDEKIFAVSYAEQKINFRAYVEYWFDFKNRHAGKDADGKRIAPIEYTIGKIMQNSLYGKLAQDPTNYYDYKIVPGDFKHCQCHGDFKCDLPDDEHGWELADEATDNKLVRRPTLWRYKNKFGVAWTGERLYKNVATAASITGFVRAHILRAMHTVGIGHVIYTDTDSLMVKAGADYSNIPMGDVIGDWELEIKNAPLGLFAGKKLYGIKKADGKEKLAHKGAKLTFPDYRKLIDGKTIVWEAEAPHFKFDGKADFVVRNIRSTAIQKETT